MTQKIIKTRNLASNCYSICILLLNWTTCRKEAYRNIRKKLNKSLEMSLKCQRLHTKDKKIHYKFAQEMFKYIFWIHIYVKRQWFIYFAKKCKYEVTLNTKNKTKLVNLTDGLLVTFKRKHLFFKLRFRPKHIYNATDDDFFVKSVR